jgi:integrase/recombinase XerD
MPYQFVREPLTAEEAGQLAKACETPTERLVVWTLLDTGLRVSELCDLTSKKILWTRQRLVKEEWPLWQEGQGTHGAAVEPGP